MKRPIADQLLRLGEKLLADLKQHSVRKIAQSQVTGRVEYDEFWPSHSKGIIDEIDDVLGTHYGFTNQEIDFVKNYDYKYRMGRNSGED